LASRDASLDAPADGAGAHPKIASSGWDASWPLPVDQAALIASIECHPADHGAVARREAKVRNVGEPHERGGAAQHEADQQHLEERDHTTRVSSSARMLWDDVETPT
jgi:hypothetical protein